MKKRLVVCLLLGILLLLPLTAAAEGIPDALGQLLGDGEVVSWAEWKEAEQSTWFVLTCMQDGSCTLHCFTGKNGAWAETFRTRDAIPQEGRQTAVYISEEAWNLKVPEDSKERYIQGPILILLQYDADNTAVDWMINFARSQAGVWELIAIRNYSRAVNIDVGSDGLTFYAMADKAQSVTVGSAPCCFDRDIRSFCLAEVPLTFQQAQEMAFSAQPSVP